MGMKLSNGDKPVTAGAWPFIVLNMAVSAIALILTHRHTDSTHMFYSNVCVGTMHDVRLAKDTEKKKFIRVVGFPRLSKVILFKMQS